MLKALKPNVQYVFFDAKSCFSMDMIHDFIYSSIISEDFAVKMGITVLCLLLSFKFSLILLALGHTNIQ